MAGSLCQIMRLNYQGNFIQEMTSWDDNLDYQDVWFIVHNQHVNDDWCWIIFLSLQLAAPCGLSVCINVLAGLQLSLTVFECHLVQVTE